jgi:hypothetical protein
MRLHPPTWLGDFLRRGPSRGSSVFVGYEPRAGVQSIVKVIGLAGQTILIWPSFPGIRSNRQGVKVVARLPVRNQRAANHRSIRFGGELTDG